MGLGGVPDPKAGRVRAVGRIFSRGYAMGDEKMTGPERLTSAGRCRYGYAWF
jgi:hypothetical protein